MSGYVRGAVFSGARCIFSLRGQQVGFAHAVTVNEQIQREPIQVLDDVFVKEFAATGVMVSFSAQFFRLVGSSLKRFGFWPAADHLSILTHGELDATIRDEVTQQTLVTLHRCVCSSRALEISARGIAGMNTEWQAVRVTDETGT